jgi:hypothetical protein
MIENTEPKYKYYSQIRELGAVTDSHEELVLWFQSFSRLDVSWEISQGFYTEAIGKKVQYTFLLCLGPVRHESLKIISFIPYLLYAVCYLVRKLDRIKVKKMVLDYSTQ